MVLPILNAKRRNKIKRKIKRKHYHAPKILGFKQTMDLTGSSHRGLVVGLRKQPNENGVWI